MIYRYTDKQDLMRNTDSINEDTILDSDSMRNSGVVGQLFNSGRHQSPTKLSEAIVRVLVCLYCKYSEHLKLIIIVGRRVCFWEGTYKLEETFLLIVFRNINFEIFDFFALIYFASMSIWN